MSVTISKNMNLAEVLALLEKLPSGKVFRAAKHCGVLKLTEEPLAYQKRIRDEWE